MGKPLSVARGAIKGVALLVGGCTTLVSAMALIGAFAASGWIRFLVALLAMLIVPAAITDRLLPKDDPARGGGVPSDVFAVSWLAFPVLVAVVLGGMTRGVLLTESQREAAAGHDWLARIAMALAGKADASAFASPAPSASTAAAASAVPSASAAAVVSAPPVPSVLPEAVPEPPPRKHAAGELTPAELFKRLAPAVVTISMLSESGRETSGGTGFVIDGAGTLVTNHHVIEDGNKVRVKFIDGATYEDLTMLVDDPDNDLAILRLNVPRPKQGKPPVFEPLKLGDSEAVVVGERAISIGNPLGLDHTLTDGLVSARRMLNGKAWIQMSVPVSPGNSGGPIFNMRGEVIGVTTAQYGNDGRAQNLNIAIPAKVVVQHLRTNYPDARPFGQRPASSHW
jgi:S1-C subfamily serine protease